MQRLKAIPLFTREQYQTTPPLILITLPFTVPLVHPVERESKALLLLPYNAQGTSLDLETIWYGGVWPIQKIVSFPGYYSDAQVNYLRPHYLLLKGASLIYLIFKISIWHHEWYLFRNFKIQVFQSRKLKYNLDHPNFFRALLTLLKVAPYQWFIKCEFCIKPRKKPGLLLIWPPKLI